MTWRGSLQLTVPFEEKTCQDHSQITDQTTDQMTKWNHAPSQNVVKPAAAAQSAGTS